MNYKTLKSWLKSAEESSYHPHEEKAYRAAIKAVEKLQSFLAVGTLAEFKELKEKSEPKRPIDKLSFEECPRCQNVDIAGCQYCPSCGQKLELRKRGEEL